MKTKYNSEMLIKISSNLKDEAAKKADRMDKTLSGYVRDLIFADLNKK